MISDISNKAAVDYAVNSITKYLKSAMFEIASTKALRIFITLQMIAKYETSLFRFFAQKYNFS